MQKILVVDDHPDIRQLVRILLDRHYEVLEAETGEEAIDIARRHIPAAAILDIMMPGALNGFQVLSAIKNDTALRSIYVVMVTACGQASDYDQATALGADAYFVKPFSPLSLVSHIREQVAN
jgi:CheY-like chemotaxis protein